MSRLIGIDLGTTNSCVAVMEGGRPTLIPNADGSRTTASVVAFTKNGERLVGAVAKRQAATNTERTISSIKREMGSKWTRKIDGHTYNPQEISAIILRKLKADAEAFLGEEVTDAVITVPAYFNDAQRQATKDAGQIAGLNVARIINEPTAAALAYGVDKEEPKKVMVFDLGGGTFDVSILDIQDGVIDVKATAGNNRLGGDDFDAVIVDWLVTGFKKDKGIDLSKDPAAMQRLKEAAEAAKIDLSAQTTTTINLPFISSKGSEPVHLERTLTRAEFDKMTEHLVKATIPPMKQAMSDAGISVSDLGKTLLVGGSTRIPAVRDAVKAFTGKDPYQGINPDECVALGACLQAGVLAGKVGGLLLLDVTPLTLGVETVGDVATCMIPRNSTIPISRTEMFSTAANFQTTVEINVLQGENPRASKNRSLGKFRLSGIRRAMRGVPRIEVTFSLDANGIVHVTARDLDTGKQQQVTIEGSSNMSQKAIDAASRNMLDYERKMLGKGKD